MDAMVRVPLMGYNPRHLFFKVTKASRTGDRSVDLDNVVRAWSLGKQAAMSRDVFRFISVVITSARTVVRISSSHN